MKIHRALARACALGTVLSIVLIGAIAGSATFAGATALAPADPDRAPAAANSPDEGCNATRPDRIWIPSDGSYAALQKMKTPVCQSWLQSDSLVVNRSDVVWALNDKVTQLSSTSASADIFRTITINQLSEEPLVPFLAPGESAVVVHAKGFVASFSVDKDLTALWIAQEVVEQKIKKSSTAAAISLIGNDKARRALGICAVAAADAAPTITGVATTAELWTESLRAAATQPACSTSWSAARSSVGSRVYPQLDGSTQLVGKVGGGAGSLDDLVAKGSRLCYVVPMICSAAPR